MRHPIWSRQLPLLTAFALATTLAACGGAGNEVAAGLSLSASERSAAANKDVPEALQNEQPPNDMAEVAATDTPRSEATPMSTDSAVPIENAESAEVPTPLPDETEETNREEAAPPSEPESGRG